MRNFRRLFINLLAVLLGSTIAVCLYTLSHGNFINHRTPTVQDFPGVNELKASAKVAHGPLKGAPSYAVEDGGFIAFQSDPEFMFRRNTNYKKSTCPNSLQEKMAKTEWTSWIYRPDIRMVLHNMVMNLKEYKRLLPYWMPYGFKYHQNFTYEDLIDVLQLYPPEDFMFDFKPNMRPECISCAVVGNGGILNNSKQGKEIDSHDMVFRVNHALRHGHEEDVGSKLTHYVFMDRSLLHTSKPDLPLDEGTIYVFLPCRLNDYKYIVDVATGRDPKQKLKVDAKSIRILHPDFTRYVHKIWMTTKSFRPSTGYMMFLAALHAGCDTLSVYGMGFNTKYSEHYYDKTYKKYVNFKASHDFRKEILILKHLEKDGIISWYKRDVPEFLS